MNGGDTETHMLAEYERQNGCSELCQEYDQDEQEELHKQKKQERET